MGNKKRKLSVAISAFISTVNSISNVEKITEIIKIKFILKEVIKTREKMGKKSSAKKVRKEFESLEKNRIEKIEEISTQDINLKELKKYEKIKKFRNLEKVNIIYSNNEKDKFKDFQEIYNLINIKLEVKNKKWIFSQKDNIYYIFPYDFFVTERLKGEYSIFRSAKEDKINRDIIKKVSYKIREKGFEFNLPEERSIKLLNSIGFLGNGNWVYYQKQILEYMTIKDSFNYSDNYTHNLIGVYKLDNFFNSLKYRNKNFNFIENEDLKNFEVILNYNLLDSTIITKEFEKSFNNLVEVYKTYKNYISCIYNKDDENIGILFDIDKITESIKNKKKVFDSIEIPYFPNKLGIEKEIVHLDKNIYYYKNGDIEEVYNENSGENKSIYYFKNGDEEKRIYKNGILDGESTITFKKDGSSEIREYKKGILQGEAIFKKDNQVKKYYYTDGLREEMPVLKYYLSIDKERIYIDDYDEERLWDINLGHWDLQEEDKEELKEILGKKVYERDPKEDVHQGGIVGIDFGTKSTVVVYQKDKTNIMPMRISGGKLNKKVDDKDYENPTVIEFRNIKNFLEKYNEKDGRPNTRWEDVMVSHTAFTNLTEGPSEYFTSIISDIKQWTTKEKEKHYLKDRTGSEYTLAPYLKIDENEENYIDPVELYAYYIGSYINTMTNGIYLEYLLSFPVTYEKAIREKILKSFEKGIKKSLPIQIQEDEKLMKKFKVKHGANEPAAYAACALKNFKIEPKDKDDKIYYGVFDFGGGTTDFDFGIWKLAEDEDKYDYELEHFGAGGDKYLGGENIIKELAYKVFTENSDTLLKREIKYTRPESYDELKGEGALVNNDSSIAKLNTRILGEVLRGIWENSATEDMKTVKLSYLYDTHGEKRGMGGDDELSFNISEEELNKFIREKIDKGINNFFIKLEDAFKDEDAKEINIFLAGNSCKHPFVNEIFAEYQEKMKDKIKLNLYDLKAIESLKEKDSTKVMPTGKTGVAYGLIYSRKGGRIKVTNRDEKENMANEVNFKFYIGNNKRDLFNTVLSPNSKYEKYEYFGKVTSDTFEIYYTTLPEAQTGKMEIDKTNVKRISLNEEYDEDEEYRIYIKATKPTKISYAIVKKEEDVDTKEFLEEGEIALS